MDPSQSAALSGHVLVCIGCRVQYNNNYNQIEIPQSSGMYTTRWQNYYMYWYCCCCGTDRHQTRKCDNIRRRADLLGSY